MYYECLMPVTNAGCFPSSLTNIRGLICAVAQIYLSIIPTWSQNHHEMKNHGEGGQ